MRENSARRWIVMSAIIFVASLAPTNVQAEWRTGGYERRWDEGQKCGGDLKSVCIEIHQHGAGTIGPIFGTQNCFRRQIWTTRISGVPDNIDKFNVDRATGEWTVGVDNVEIRDGAISVRTFVVQDHGGPGNTCLRQGHGSFVIRFWSSEM